MEVDLSLIEMDDALFEQFRRLLYDTCGIRLNDGKSGLVKARLMKRLRALGIASFGEYLRCVREDATGRELTAMIDVLTTNKTSFFREPQHFDFLRREVIPSLRAAGRARFWSAGCSTGEEPYSLAILLREAAPDIDRLDARILATDISTRVLATARAGIYEEDRLTGVPAEIVGRHFEALPGRRRAYQVRPTLRRLVSLARLNLLEAWPMAGPFDAIFCRNVMIYFDKPTQTALVRRFAALLRPGGHLFVGHSESLLAQSVDVRYVQPAVYVR